jgi:hypothetical protein
LIINQYELVTANLVGMLKRLNYGMSLDGVQVILLRKSEVKDSEQQQNGDYSLKKSFRIREV